MGEIEANRHGRHRWVSWVVLSVLLLVALLLRWRYIREISLFVDEFVTAWAARSVLAHGLPIFPSGNIYPHGFIFTYLEVPFVLGKFDETLVRIPGLLVSLAGLPVAYVVGRRLFSEQVGLIAAAAMAVDPDSIIWGGRARMYGLLQLLALLIVYVYYRGLVEDRARDRFLAMGLLILAIFTHAQAAFLLPVLGLATLLILPWRRLFRWSVVLPFVLAGAGAILFFLIAKFGQPGHLETLQESRPYLGVSADLLTGPRVFAPVFTSLYRVAFSLLGLAGLYFVFRPRFDRRAPLTYLYVVFVGYALLIVFLAGATWQRDRYLFMVLPLLFLIAGEVLTRLLAFVPRLRAPRAWQSAALALIVAVYVGLTGAHGAYIQDWGYDLAFRYLQERWQPEAGDRIATLMPPVPMLYLGQNDWYAIQRGYEEYVVKRPQDNVPVDLWTASPVLTETAAFADLIASVPRLWLVVDGWRFQTNYDADFILTVLEQMQPDFTERGVTVFRSEGYKPLPEPAVQRQRYAEFGANPSAGVGGDLALTGFDLSSSHPEPGGELDITLHWQALEQAGPAYTAYLHLLRLDGTGVAGIDEPVLRGFYQPDLWPKDKTLPDRHRLTLPPDLPPGEYRLDLGLYRTGQPGSLLPVAGDDHLPLAMLTVGEVASPPSPATPTDINFGEQIELSGYSLETVTDHELQITPYWQAIGQIERDYTVFVHLVDADGKIVAQDDGPPGDPFFPTSTWLPGDVVVDPHQLALPADLPPGEYTLEVGLYFQPTGERLQYTDARTGSPSDTVRIGPIPINLEAP